MPTSTQSERILCSQVENAKRQPVPESSRPECLITLGIVTAYFLYLCLFRRYTWLDFDEGILLQGAQRIVDGQVLYRDFFSFFTPGSYYFLALMFRVFGSSLVVAHTALAAIGAGMPAITYLLSRRVCSRAVSMLVAALMALTTLPLRFIILHNWDSTLLACLAIYCSIRFLETASQVWLFPAASFVSLTAMFEQSKGAGLLLGLGLGFALIAWRGKDKALFRPAHWLTGFVGMTWPIAIVAAYFLSQHAFNAMLTSWFWPLQHYSMANHVPYGYSNLTESSRAAISSAVPASARMLNILLLSPILWFPLLPLFATPLFIYEVACIWRKKRLSRDSNYYVLISASIAGLLLSVMIARQDYLHFAYLNPVFFLVIAWFLGGRSTPTIKFVRTRSIIAFVLTISLLIFGAGLLIRARSSQELLTRRGDLRTPMVDEVVEYLQDRVPAGERILVYPYEPTYYYLTATYSPTRYEFFQPGMNTEAQALSMLSELQTHPVRIVLYQVAFAEHVRRSWPNTSERALSDDLVGAYIRDEYRSCATLNSAASLNAAGNFRFLFMIRKDLPCP